MATKTLRISNHALEKIKEYQHLIIDGKELNCPYYINTKRNKDLRAMVGKGDPEEIKMEAKIWEKLKGVNFSEMQTNEIKQFLIDRGIGIDCSGFVTHVLDHWYFKVNNKHIWNDLKIPGRGILSWIKYLLRPVEKLGADVLTGPENADPIEIRNVKPGDVIRSKWKKSGTHHIQLITDVEYEMNNEEMIPVKIKYIHSTPYYGEDNGVKSGEIKIIDINKSLKEQEWEERDEHGVNFSYEGYLTNVEDNGLRRIRCMKKLIES